MSNSSEDLQSILTELSGRAIKEIMNLIHIKPLASIIADYAEIDQYGMFMRVTSIHMRPSYVIPIETEYSIRVGTKKNKMVEIVVCEIGNSRRMSSHAYKERLDNQGKTAVSHLYNPKKMYQLIIAGDAAAIGDLLKKNLNKPWWKREQTEKVGRVCIEGIVLKAKFMLQMQSIGLGKQPLPTRNRSV